MLVLIKGAGDIASGIAYRLLKSGFRIVMTELEEPRMIRRTVSYGEAVNRGQYTVEGITSRKVQVSTELSLKDKLESIWGKEEIPVLVDPEGQSIKIIRPQIIVDSILAKTNTGTYKRQASLTIGIGPGFTAGDDVDLVIETIRGHNLGRVIYQGSAVPDTGIPGDIGGESIKRLIRSPTTGIFKGNNSIGDFVDEGQIVGHVNKTPVYSNLSGILRGLIKSDIKVHHGMKIGDVDPRSIREHCFTISDKARSIGGGVLEAILASCNLNELALK